MKLFEAERWARKLKLGWAVKGDCDPETVMVALDSYKQTKTVPPDYPITVVADHVTDLPIWLWRYTLHPLVREQQSRYRAHRLTLDDVLGVALQAVALKCGYAATHGGLPKRKKASTTAALAVRRYILSRDLRMVSEVVVGVRRAQWFDKLIYAYAPTPAVVRWTPTMLAWHETFPVGPEGWTVPGARYVDRPKPWAKSLLGRWVSDPYDPHSKVRLPVYATKTPMRPHPFCEDPSCSASMPLASYVCLRCARSYCSSHAATHRRQHAGCRSSLVTVLEASCQLTIPFPYSRVVP